jgi:hypothetical protein
MATDMRADLDELVLTAQADLDHDFGEAITGMADLAAGRVVDPEQNISLPPSVEVLARGISIKEVLASRIAAGYRPTVIGPNVSQVATGNAAIEELIGSPADVEALITSRMTSGQVASLIVSPGSSPAAAAWNAEIHRRYAEHLKDVIDDPSATIGSFRRRLGLDQA